MYVQIYVGIKFFFFIPLYKVAIYKKVWHYKERTIKAVALQARWDFQFCGFAVTVAVSAGGKCTVLVVLHKR